MARLGFARLRSAAGQHLRPMLLGRGLGRRTWPLPFSSPVHRRLASGSRDELIATGTPIRSAVISSDGKYRYHLRREIPGGGSRVANLVMLNPSTADHLVEDPTIRKYIGFCQRWRCGVLNVMNPFAVRAIDPPAMLAALDPVGEDNRDWVMRAVEASRSSYESGKAGPVVSAWGTNGGYMAQAQTLLGWIEDIC